MKSALLATAAIGALAASGTASPDDDLANARVEFDAIVRIATGWSRVPEGASLTRRVHEFLSHEAATIHHVEAEAWEVVSRDEPYARSYRPVVECTLRFLHGLPPQQSPDDWVRASCGGFEVLAEAIVMRDYLRQGARYPCVEPPRLALQDLVGSTPLRRPPSPRAAELLAAITSTAVEGLCDPGRMDLGMALGEVCGTDDAAFAELTQRAVRSPDDAVLLLAMGWSGRSAAVPVLSERLVELAGGKDIRDGIVHLDPLRAAANALSHLDPGAFERVVSGLPRGERDRVVEQLGCAALVRWRLASTRSTASGRALLRLCAIDPFRADVRMPAGADASLLVDALLTGIDSGEKDVRSAALEAGENYLFAFGRSPIRSRVATEAESTGTTGESLGSYAGPETTLRMLAGDLQGQRIEFHDAEPGVFARRVAEVGRPDAPALTDVPGEGTRLSSGGAPVHLSAKWTETGLRLNLRNDGERPIAVNPVALRYGSADVVTVTTTVRGKPPVSTRRLQLHLGRIRSYAVVPTRALVVLAPKGELDCDLPVNEALRGAEHVDLELDSGIPALGDSAVPVAVWGLTPVL